MLDYAREGIDYPHIAESIVEGSDLVQTILNAAKSCDLVLIGASEEPIFRNILVGPITEQVARAAQVTVIVVKRRTSRIHSIVRQTMLAPTEPVGLPKVDNGSG